MSLSETPVGGWSDLWEREFCAELLEVSLESGYGSHSLSLSKCLRFGNCVLMDLGSEKLPGLWGRVQEHGGSPCGAWVLG